MGNLTQHNINFTVNNTEIIGGFGTKRTNSSLLTNSKYDTTKKQTLINGNYESTSNGFSINAVDIDWNNAEVGNDIIIKNTGDLLAWIKSQNNNINDNAITSNINGLKINVVDTMPENPEENTLYIVQ